MAFIEDDEIVQVFIEESREHLDGIESDFLEIEKDGADVNVDLVNNVFRAIHSIKGGAGFLGLEQIKALAHEMENLLNLIRNNELIPTPEIMSALLTANDKLNLMIDNFAESNEMDISEELVMLKGATSASLPDEEKETLDTLETISLPDGQEIFTVKVFDLDQAQKAGRILYLANFDLIRDIERKDKTPLDVIKEIQQAGMLLESKIDIDAIGTIDEQTGNMAVPFYVLFSTVLEHDLVDKLIGLDEKKIYFFDKERHIFPLCASEQSGCHAKQEQVDLDTVESEMPQEVTTEENNFKETPQEPPVGIPAKEKIKAHNAVAPSEKAATPVTRKTEKQPPREKKEAAHKNKNETLRVNLKELDTLMTLAGELVLTRNQLLQVQQNKDQTVLDNAIQRVDLITAELQEAIMATRMQPIGMVFNKFQRVVRDLSKQLNKKIELIIDGENVEMDKTIIESIGDPLTHLVRNSVDHGVEDAETRAALGKSPTAVIRLSAFHEAGQVVIKIEDDGAGIDAEKVKAKAIERGFIDAAEANEMAESELIKLIFKPGFSMAREVTEISGRGVGMDVVFSNLSQLGGTIDIHSKLNVGTTITIKLPLTLAIIPSLIVRVHEDRYAIPQVNLLELVRIPHDQIKNRIEKIDDATVMRLRGALLPVIDLNDAISNENKILDGLETKADTENKKQPLNIVVLNAGNFNYGIIVNELLDSEEIVVKPLGTHLRHLETYAGATILGDGRAALILDIIGISKAMNLKPVKQKAKDSDISQMENLLGQKDSQSMIVVNNGTTEQFAFPLGLISRIEKIHKDDLVITSGKTALKYRGGNLIVLSIDDVANVQPRVEVENPYVIVFKFGGHEVGIIVSNIVDVVDSAMNVDEDTFRQPGIVGSAIILDKITLMVDLYGLASAAMPERVLEREEEVQKTHAEKQNTILIVEDSKFFLNQIRGFTEDAGYKVVTALDGLEGLDRLHEAPEEIDLVLTDIEMPNLDGIGFTKEVRAEQQFQKLPILALTSVAGDEAEKIANEAGIDEYLIKLDREKVLKNIEDYLKNGRQN